MKKFKLKRNCSIGASEQKENESLSSGSCSCSSSWYSTSTKSSLLSSLDPKLSSQGANSKAMDEFKAQMCQSHKELPCKVETCPLYGTELRFAWYYCVMDSEHSWKLVWTKIEGKAMNHLERAFGNPYCTGTTVVLEGTRVLVHFSHSGEVSVDEEEKFRVCRVNDENEEWALYRRYRPVDFDCSPILTDVWKFSELRSNLCCCFALEDFFGHEEFTWWQFIGHIYSDKKDFTTKTFPECSSQSNFALDKDCRRPYRILAGEILKDPKTEYAYFLSTKTKYLSTDLSVVELDEYMSFYYQAISHYVATQNRMLTVVSVARINHLKLGKSWMRYKQMMQTKNGRVNEAILFKAISGVHSETSCMEQCFGEDGYRRKAATKGYKFQTNLSLALCFDANISTVANKTQCVIIVRALIGRYGKASCRSSRSIGLDAFVDSLETPSEVVIAEAEQILPLFVVTVSH